MDETVCWVPTWSPAFANVGLEHVVVTERGAHSVLLAIDDEHEPLRLAYTIDWDARRHVRAVRLESLHRGHTRSLSLTSDGAGHWHNGEGLELPQLNGCIDIDIWPTPLTNSLPIWRSDLKVGERREFQMAWIAAPELTVEPKPQAYARTAESSYLFESLDGTGFKAELPVDGHQLVVDYPGLFRRVRGVAKPGRAPMQP